MAHQVKRVCLHAVIFPALPYARSFSANDMLRAFWLCGSKSALAWNRCCLNAALKSVPDKYANFVQLEAAEPVGSYRIERVSRETPIAIIAPHAGRIEPGTSEVCRAIAGGDQSYYLFEGCKASNNSQLHITSAGFDEPQGMAIAQSARVVVTIHGQAGDGEFINVGGIDASIGQVIIERLQAEGYTASRHRNAALQGLNPANICNQGCSGGGIQLEISRGLRDRLVASAVEMDRFAKTIRASLATQKL